MAILELRAARGWSIKQTADTFLVTPATKDDIFATGKEFIAGLSTDGDELIGQFVVGIVVRDGRIEVDWEPFAETKLLYKDSLQAIFRAEGGEADYSVLAEVRPHPRRVHLKTRDGRYVLAEGGGGKAVNAKRTQAKTLETFTLIDQNGLTPLIVEFSPIIVSFRGLWLRCQRAFLNRFQPSNCRRIPQEP